MFRELQLNRNVNKIFLQWNTITKKCEVDLPTTDALMLMLMFYIMEEIGI